MKNKDKIGRGLFPITQFAEMRSGMTLEEAIKTANAMFASPYFIDAVSIEDVDALALVLSAAEKWAAMGKILEERNPSDILRDAERWAVIEWMRRDGFADAYKFLSIMENWKNYEDAYKKENQ